MNGEVGELAVLAPTKPPTHTAMNTAASAANATWSRRSASTRRLTPILMPQRSSAYMMSRPGMPSSMMRLSLIHI